MLWATTSKYIFSKQPSVLSTKHCNCLGNKDLNYSYAKSWIKVLNTVLEKIGVKELTYKVITSSVFLVAYANTRKTCKVSLTLLF